MWARRSTDLRADSSQDSITRQLLSAIEAGQFPQTTTIVQCFFPPVVSQARYVQLGMKQLDQRRTVFECFEAFKAFVVSKHFRLLVRFC